MSEYLSHTRIYSLSCRSQEESWDGTYNGEILKSDSYIWKVKATFMDGTEWEGQESKPGKKFVFGNVMLLR